MACEHEKSATTVFFDVARNALVLVATGVIVWLIWERNLVVALLAAIPIYILMLNLVGFLTLPLYSLTPENRLKRKTMEAFMNSEFARGRALTDEFAEKFNVNIPHGDSRED